MHIIVKKMGREILTVYFEITILFQLGIYLVILG
jgi:hypothetical protein